MRRGRCPKKSWTPRNGSKLRVYSRTLAQAMFASTIRATWRPGMTGVTHTVRWRLPEGASPRIRHLFRGHCGALAQATAGQIGGSVRCPCQPLSGDEL
jgi:hypothetical protein